VCDAAWAGKAAERACLAFQRRVLLELNADNTIIAHIEKHALDPTYQDATKVGEAG